MSRNRYTLKEVIQAFLDSGAQATIEPGAYGGWGDLEITFRSKTPVRPRETAEALVQYVRERANGYAGKEPKILREVMAQLQKEQGYHDAITSAVAVAEARLVDEARSKALVAAFKAGLDKHPAYVQIMEAETVDEIVRYSQSLNKISGTVTVLENKNTLAALGYSKPLNPVVRVVSRLFVKTKA